MAEIKIARLFLPRLLHDVLAREVIAAPARASWANPVARVDHVDHEGKSLRDLVAEKLERFRADRTEVPLRLAKLEARLRDR